MEKRKQEFAQPPLMVKKRNVELGGPSSQGPNGLPLGYGTMRMKPNARMAVSNIGNVQTQIPDFPRHIDAVPIPTGPPVLPQSYKNSSWNLQAQANREHQATENTPRPLPYPPVANFTQSSSVNLGPTFEQMSRAISMNPHHMHNQHAHPSGAQTFPFRHGLASHSSTQSFSGPVPPGPATIRPPKPQGNPRKQADMQGSSWRRSDDVRNFTGTDSLPRFCPNKSSEKNDIRPYVPCECEWCEDRNKSIYVQVLGFHRAYTSEQETTQLQLALESLLGEVRQVVSTGLHARAFIVK